MFDILEGILHELKDVPGLSFLKSIHAQLSSKRARAMSKMRDFQNRKNSLIGTSRNINRKLESPKGSKRRND